VILLWHRQEPIGICIFSSPAASLSLRSQFFGLSYPRSRIALASLNEQLWVLQRVVLHPTYRGAGIAAAFVRRACELCPVPWIETLSAMGQVNPFFERAGFRRVGVIQKKPNGADARGAYGHRGRTRIPMPARHEHSEPVYYILDNRTNRRIDFRTIPEHSPSLG
jgi:GNAT superfamily N-acetyltransferase